MTQTAKVIQPQAANRVHFEKNDKRECRINSEKPNTEVSLWPMAGDTSPAIFTLTRTSEQWLGEDLEILRMIRTRNIDEHPTPVLQITDAAGHIRGVIHLRKRQGQLQLNMSLLNRREIWQTGVWLDIDARDELSLAWCTNMSGTELHAISLEISPFLSH